MLGGIEQLLLRALRNALPGQDVLAGGLVPPVPAARLLVHATALTLPVVAAAEPEPDNREPAFAFRVLTIAPDAGDPRNFTLPSAFDGTADRIGEVVTPAGAQLRPGEGYQLDGRLIRCYAAPGGPLQLTAIGARARGYVERGACALDLLLTAYAPPGEDWETAAPAADALLAAALGNTLTVFAESSVLDLGEHAPTGLRLRLLHPIARLGSISRDFLPVGADPARVGARAAIALRGELELTLAQGVPDQTGTIATVEPSVAVVR